jgi:hypothetical protein
VSGLHRVEDARAPLTAKQMQEHGNKLVTEARVAAIDAVRASMHSEFIEKGKSVTPADIRRWRSKARASIDAWRAVESLTTELLNDLKRAEPRSPEGTKR